jgi:glutamine synthetase
MSAALLPKSLEEALTALRADDCFRQGFGGGFVDYYAHIKSAELARFAADERDRPEPTAWEQREYFDLF